MKNLNLYEAFLEKLNKKISHKPTLVNQLADLLIMEKESVYRRLRGAVPFTLNETGIIARNFNISLDEITGIDDFQLKSHLYQMGIYPKNSPVLMQEEELEKFYFFLKDISSRPDAEWTVILNNLSLHNGSFFPHLLKFYVFKWRHRFHVDYGKTTYEQTQIPEIILEMEKRINKYAMDFAYTTLIWDKNIVNSLLKEIDYYKKIELISSESIEKIKDEILSLIDELEVIARYGYYPLTGNKFAMYESNTPVYHSFAYISTTEDTLSILSMFDYQTCLTAERNVCERLEQWGKALKRTSTLISGVGEKDRIMFFNRLKLNTSKL